MPEIAELMAGTTPRLSYEQVSDFYRFAREASPYFKGLSLAEFSKQANEEFGVDAFSAGTSTGLKGLAKRYSLGVERIIRPATRLTGEAGRAVAEYLGAGPEIQELSREMGAALPRGIAETGAVVLGASLGPPGWATLVPAGALSAASRGVETTDSSLVGLIQGASTAAIPGFAKLGHQFVTKPLVRRLTQDPIYTRIGNVTYKNFHMKPELSKRVGGLAQRGLEYLGPQIGMAVDQEAAIQATSLALGEGLVDPFTLEHGIQMFGANLPFAILDLQRIIRTPKLPKSLRGGPGGDLDFASASELRSALSYQRTLSAQRDVETANEIDTFLKTAAAGRKRQLPFPRGRTFAGGIDQPPTITPGVRLVRPAAVNVGKDVHIPTSLFEKWNRLVDQTQRTTVFRRGTLKQQGLDDKQADEMVAALQQRGFLGADRGGGVFPVVRASMTNDYQLLRDVIRIMARERGISFKPPPPRPTTTTTPTPTTSTTTPTPTPPAPKPTVVNVPSGTTPPPVATPTGATVVAAPVVKPWPVRVLELKAEGKTLVEIYSILEKEGHTFARTAGSYRQMMEVFNGKGMPPEMMAKEPWPKYVPAGPPIKGYLPEPVVPEEGAESVTMKPPEEAVTAPSAVQLFLGGIQPAIPIPPGEGTVVREGGLPEAAAQLDIQRAATGPTTRTISTEVSPEAALKPVGRVYNLRPEVSDPERQHLAIETERGEFLSHEEAFTVDSLFKRVTPGTVVKSFGYIRIGESGQVGYTPIRTLPEPRVWGQEQADAIQVWPPQRLAGMSETGYGNEVELFLRQYEAIRGRNVQDTVLGDEPLSPTEAAFRVGRMVRLMRELVNEVAKDHKRKPYLKTDEQIQQSMAELLSQGYSPDEVAARIYQLQINELNKGLEFLATEENRVLDSFEQLPVEVVKQREARIRAALARLNELPGEEATVRGELDMQTEIVEMTTIRDDKTARTITKEDGTTVRLPGIRLLRSWDKASSPNYARIGVMDEMYAAAVDFKDNRAALIEKWRQQHADIVAEGEMSPLEIEREAFRRHVLYPARLREAEDMRTEVSRKTQTQKLMSDLPESFRGGPEEDVDSPDYRRDELIYSRTPEDEAGLAGATEQMEANRTFLRDTLPEEPGKDAWVEYYLKATGQSRVTGDKSVLVRNLQVSLDLVRDGIIGLREITTEEVDPKTGRFKVRTELSIREEQGVTRENIRQMLGHQDWRSSREFLTQRFLPTLKELITRAKALKASGEDPRRWLGKQPGQEPSTEGPQRLPQPPDLGELARASAVPEAVMQPQVAPDAGLNLIVGSRAFFKQYFVGRGISPDVAEGYTKIAMRVAGMFNDVGFVRIATLISDEAAGIAQEGLVGRTSAFIGLDPTSYSKYPEELKRFFMFKLLGHEIWHLYEPVPGRQPNVADPARVKALSMITEWATNLPPETRAIVLRDAFGATLPPEYYKKAESFINHRANVAADSPREFLADYSGLLVAGLASPDNSVRATEFAGQLVVNQPVGNFAKSLYVSLNDITLALSAHYDWLAQHGSPKTYLKAAETVKYLNNRIRSTLTELKVVDEAVEMIRRMEQADPSRYWQLVDRGLIDPVKHTNLNLLRSKLFKTPPVMSTEFSSLPKDYVDEARMMMGLQSKRELEKAFGVQPRWFERWMYPAAQLANRYPVLWPVFDLAFSYRSVANRFENEILAPFMTKTRFGRPVLDADRSGLNKAFNDKGVNAAITRIALIKQERGFQAEEGGAKGEDLVKAGLLSDAEMKSMMPELSPERQQSVIDFHRNTEIAMPRAAQAQVDMARRSVAHMAGLRMMVKDRTLGEKVAKSASYDLVEGLRLINQTTDPTAVMMGTRYLEDAKGKVTPEAYQAAFETARDLMENVQRLEQHLANKPWYIPEVRSGQYIVAWAKGARGFEDILSAQKFRDELQAKGVKSRVWKRYDKQKQYAGLRDDYVTAWSRIEEGALKRALADYGMSGPDAEEFLKMGYRPGEAVAKEMIARGIGKFLLKRKLAEGRESINAAEGVIDYVVSLSNGLSKRFVKEQSALALSDPTIRDQPQARELARSHLNTVLNPPTREWTMFKNMNFLYFMGFNLSSMLMETSQPLMSLAPYLTRQVVGNREIGIGGGYVAITDGVSKYVKSLLNKGRFVDDELQSAVERARTEQVLDFGVLQEFYLDQDSPVANIRNLMTGDSAVVKGAELLKKPAFWYLHSARSLYALATRANGHIAFVSAFEAARQRGMKSSEAYDFAVRTVRSTMFGGGAAARPVEPFAKSGELHGAVGAVYSLQSYTYSMIAMMARLAEESIGRVPNMTPADRLGARKAFAQATVTQFIAAGALGLPMVSGAIGVLEQMFPDLQLRKNLRVWLQDVAGEDEKMGNMVADVALNGVANYWTGMDFASRLSLGQALGVDQFKGFSMANIVGPIGGVLENVFKGGSELSVGDFGEAGKLMVPRAFRGAVTLASDDWAFRDKGGRLIDNPSTAEQLMFILGVTPKTVKDYREQQALIRRSEDVADAQIDRFHNDLASRLEQGDIQGVRQSLLTRAREDSGYNPRAGARRVAEVLLDRTTPVDPSREGRRANASERADIARTFARRPLPSEMERLKGRKNLESLLIGQSTLSPSEVMMAQLVDRLMAVNPGLSRQQALDLIERQLHPRSFAVPAGGVVPQR